MPAPAAALAGNSGVTVEIGGDPAALRGAAQAWLTAMDEILLVHDVLTMTSLQARASWEGAAADGFGRWSDEMSGEIVLGVTAMEQAASALNDAADAIEAAQAEVEALTAALPPLTPMNAAAALAHNEAQAKAKAVAEQLSQELAAIAATLTGLNPFQEAATRKVGTQTPGLAAVPPAGAVNPYTPGAIPQGSTPEAEPDSGGGLAGGIKDLIAGFGNVMSQGWRELEDASATFQSLLSGEGLRPRRNPMVDRIVDNYRPSTLLREIAGVDDPDVNTGSVPYQAGEFGADMIGPLPLVGAGSLGAGMAARGARASRLQIYATRLWQSLDEVAQRHRAIAVAQVRIRTTIHNQATNKLEERFEYQNLVAMSSREHIDDIQLAAQDVPVPNQARGHAEPAIFQDLARLRWLHGEENVDVIAMGTSQPICTDCLPLFRESNARLLGRQIAVWEPGQFQDSVRQMPLDRIPPE